MFMKKSKWKTFKNQRLWICKVCGYSPILGLLIFDCIPDYAVSFSHGNFTPFLTIQVPEFWRTPLFGPGFPSGEPSLPFFFFFFINLPFLYKQPPLPLKTSQALIWRPWDHRAAMAGSVPSFYQSCQEHLCTFVPRAPFCYSLMQPRFATATTSTTATTVTRSRCLPLMRKKKKKSPSPLFTTRWLLTTTTATSICPTTTRRSTCAAKRTQTELESEIKSQ